MKNNFILLGLIALFTVSCQQKEMNVSRSNYSVMTALTDVSPAYITKNAKGKIELNKNNLIGNTHWVLSVDRDLTLVDVAPFLQELTEKKNKKGGMHEDTKDIYFVYSDTLHKQNAYVKMPFTSISLNEQPVYELGEGVESLYLTSVTDITNELNNNTTYLVSLNKKKNFETFVNILIELEKHKISKNVNGEVYIN